jgi:beta-lactamase class A
MIITSNNTATDLMIAKVGGKEKVNEFLKQNGFTASFLVQTVFELFANPMNVWIRNTNHSASKTSSPCRAICRSSLIPART